MEIYHETVTDLRVTLEEEATGSPRGPHRRPAQRSTPLRTSRTRACTPSAAHRHHPLCAPILMTLASQQHPSAHEPSPAQRTIGHPRMHPRSSSARTRARSAAAIDRDSTQRCSPPAAPSQLTSRHPRITRSSHHRQHAGLTSS
ncbi:unnamed protein product [Boreogadus saida]